MIKKIPFISIGLLLLSSPLVVAAQNTSTSDLQSQIQSLLQQIEQLQQQIAALTQNANSSSTCATPNRTLSYGSTGSDVRSLQQFFSSIGLLGSGSVTGFFGNQTQGAVRQFQSQHGIAKPGDEG